MMKGAECGCRVRIVNRRRVETKTKQLLHHSTTSPTPTKVQSDVMDTTTTNYDERITMRG
jgi:hypothetical protein